MYHSHCGHSRTFHQPHLSVLSCSDADRQVLKRVMNICTRNTSQVWHLIKAFLTLVCFLSVTGCARTPDWNPHWTKVKGVVTSMEIATTYGFRCCVGLTPRIRSYTPVVEYTYVVNTKEFHSTAKLMDWDSRETAGMASGWIKPGTMIEVWYDPTAPAHSSLGSIGNAWSPGPDNQRADRLP